MTENLRTMMEDLRTKGHTAAAQVSKTTLATYKDRINRELAAENAEWRAAVDAEMLALTVIPVAEWTEPVRRMDRRWIPEKYHGMKAELGEYGPAIAMLVEEDEIPMGGAANSTIYRWRDIINDVLRNAGSDWRASVRHNDRTLVRTALTEDEIRRNVLNPAAERAAGNARGCARPSPAKAAEPAGTEFPVSSPAAGDPGDPSARAATGARIRFAREQAGLNQRQLGVQIGAERDLVARMENGNIYIPKTVIDRIAESCGVPTEWLLTGRGTARPQPPANPGAAAPTPARGTAPLENDLTATLGGRIRIARANMRMPQHKFAEATGIHSSSISDFELGKRLPPDEYVDRIAKATGIPAGWIRDGGPLPAGVAVPDPRAFTVYGHAAIEYALLPDGQTDLATRLRFARTAQGRTQLDLAELAGTTRQRIGDFELGKATPDEHMLALIADACGVSPEWLTTGHDGPAEPGPAHGAAPAAPAPEPVAAEGTAPAMRDDDEFPDVSTTGSRIRFARRQAGMTQKQLAEAAGMTQYQIGCVEINADGVQADVIRKVSDACHIPADWLTSGNFATTLPANEPWFTARELSTFLTAAQEIQLLIDQASARRSAATATAE